MTDVSIVIICKDEKGIADTLEGLAVMRSSLEYEVVVVDASEGRLAGIADAHPGVRWIPYRQPPGKRITIPEQRNVGVRAARAPVVAFIDAACVPGEAWLDALVAPILDGSERVTVGRTSGRWETGLYATLPEIPMYLHEAPTINLAFERKLFDAVGGFDERYEYGSDIDFTWRCRHAGVALRLVPEAEVHHDWGRSRRQLKRAFQYGRARARLYRTHPRELAEGWRRDPILFIYPVFLVLLPTAVTRRLRLFPALLLIPLWRARRRKPLMTVADHLAYGAGALAFLLGGGR